MHCLAIPHFCYISDLRCLFCVDFRVHAMKKTGCRSAWRGWLVCMLNGSSSFGSQQTHRYGLVLGLGLLSDPSRGCCTFLRVIFRVWCMQWWRGWITAQHRYVSRAACRACCLHISAHHAKMLKVQSLLWRWCMSGLQRSVKICFLVITKRGRETSNTKRALL